MAESMVIRSSQFIVAVYSVDLSFAKLRCRPNVRLQPRRLMIPPAADGCKPC